MPRPPARSVAMRRDSVEQRLPPEPSISASSLRDPSGSRGGRGMPRPPARSVAMRRESEEQRLPPNRQFPPQAFAIRRDPEGVEACLDPPLDPSRCVAIQSSRGFPPSRQFPPQAFGIRKARFSETARAVDRHPSVKRYHRNRRRLRGYDYCRAGAYFVTIVIRQRARLLGSIVNGLVQLSDSGEIVVDCWNSIPSHFPAVELDQFVVMPSHIHGILWIQSNRLFTSECIIRTTQFMRELLPGLKSLSVSLSVIVGAFKSATTKRIHQLEPCLASCSAPMGRSVWQSGFHEHIILNRRSLVQVRRYITNNPSRYASPNYCAN